MEARVHKAHKKLCFVPLNNVNARLFLIITVKMTKDRTYIFLWMSILGCISFSPSPIKMIIFIRAAEGMFTTFWKWQAVDDKEEMLVVKKSESKKKDGESVSTARGIFFSILLTDSTPCSTIETLHVEVVEQEVGIRGALPFPFSNKKGSPGKHMWRGYIFIGHF